MDARLLAFAEQAAPRYTSYPTAPHFGPQIDGAAMQRWLAELEADAALSLYIHVPYCREICWYCGCNTYAAQRDEPLVDYVATLLREVDLIVAPLKAKRVKEIHWGGGTPNILSAEQFEAIVDHLRVKFDLSRVEQHAIELDPRHLTNEKCASYSKAGVTRASIGAQDFNPAVQAAMGRVQPLFLVQSAVEMLRNAGISKINMDLMFGLPGQSISDIRRSVQFAADMRPQRIALFGYAHVPWFKKRQRLIDESVLPGAAERFQQAEAARLQLTALGYRAIGLDHFALPEDELALAAGDGSLRRSFQGYVCEADAAALIGLGPSAISTLPQGYAQSHTEVGAWARAVAGGVLPSVRGHALDPDDRARRRLIEQIMCDFEGDLSLIGGRNASASELETLGPLLEAGLVILDGDRVCVTTEGKPFCRLAARAFDSYSAASSAARHSRAV